jgi:hypothetical protein
MKDEFVPYELASKLKQLGFDEPCMRYYSKDGSLITRLTQQEECSAPLFQQAFRWFREKYGIMHRLTSYAFGYQIHLDNTADFDFEFVDRRYDSSIDYKTYEEAELACLDKLIEIVETKQQES